MGGITSLYTGVSGLRSSQTAINTTSHNLVNVNTEGYVRQQIVFTDTTYKNVSNNGLNAQKVGFGVNLQDIRRIRDILLDKAFRIETGRQSFYEEAFQAVDEIEGIFGELDGVSFGTYLNELWESIQEVEKDASSMVARSALVQNAVTFINRANAIYDGLINYQSTLNTEVMNKVNRINEIGDSIDSLNKQITRVESTGIESANDLRDQRDALLDELASLIKTEYVEDTNGMVRVRTEGVVFVDITGVNYMGYEMLDTEVGSDYFTPVWPFLGGRKVYNLEVEISTAKDNDIGALKGLLLARGNSAANYTDIPNEEDPKYQLTDDNGDYLYNYEEDLDEYRRLVEPSIIRTVMGEFDVLINSIVTQINNALCPDISATDPDVGLTIGQVLTAADGSTITVNKDTRILNTHYNENSAGYGTDDDRTQGAELFSRDHTKRYIECTDANGNSYKVYNTVNEFGLESLYTLGNIDINFDVLDNKDLLGLNTKDGAVDQLRASELANQWERPCLRLGPDYVSYDDFIEFYSEFTGQVANAGDLYTNMINYQDSLAGGIDDQRTGITGVSSDEELAYLIQYQNAYNAASRYITVIDEMLEHIVTQL